MRDFGQIEAVRLVVSRRLSTGDALTENPVSVPDSIDPWEVAILRESDELFRYCVSLIQELSNLYQEDLRSRVEYDGRVVQIEFPVQLSSGIMQLSKIIGEAEEELDGYEMRLENWAHAADLGDDSAYDEMSRTAMKQSREIIERQRLHLHAYLWVLWIQEALEQANRFGEVVLKSSRLELPHGAFQYMAHAPLVVATLSTTAMIEEIGGNFLNRETDTSVNLNHTSCSEVLSELEQHYPKIESYDVNSVRTYVVDSRNDFSHYITRRGETITLDNFEEYYLAIHEGMLLGKELADQLISRIMAER